MDSETSQNFRPWLARLFASFGPLLILVVIVLLFIALYHRFLRPVRLT